MTEDNYKEVPSYKGKDQPDHCDEIPPFPLSSSVRLSLLTIFLLAGAGWFGLTTVKQELKKDLSGQLKTILSSNIEALKIWIEDKKLDAQVLASQPEIRKKILSLIEYAKSEDVNPEFLKQTKELKWLREYLGAACEKYGFIGFVLLDKTGYQVGALLEEPVGKRQLIERSDFFYRSLQGDTVVSHPFLGEVDLPDIHGAWHSNWPTMFASTPVRNQKDEIVGILAFRIRPEIAFTRMLEISRWNNTGETYAFNSEGLMISDSRFNSDLKKIGLIPDKPESRAILQLEIRDPGGNIVAGFNPSQTHEHQPFTLMAASATKGETGINVDGYNDYRGVPVVGAWTWLPDYYFGIATEIDREEAFGPLNAITKGFLLIFGLLVVSTCAACLLRIRQIHIENERNRAHKKIKENEARLRSILDNANDGIITIDKYGIIETFNPAAEETFRYKASEVIGKNIKVLMPDPYRSEHDEYLNRYLTTGSTKILGLTREVEGLRKDGSIFDLELSASKMSRSEKTQFIGIVRDITERKAAELKLKAYAVELERSNKDLQDFAAIASHDLQEPLRKIITYSDRLQTINPDLCKKGNDYLDRVQNSAERMQRLIEDLLQYSRVTTKGQPFKQVDLNKLVQQVVDDLDVVIAQKQAVVNIAPLPQIFADTFQMRQLFQNLIANALKYHKAGISPAIQVRSSQKKNGFLEIEVEDNGIGFEEKYIEKIFKPFERLHSRKEFEGTGMGLAICKKIMSSHGGEITAKSKPSYGTVFIIRLPAPLPNSTSLKPELA